MGLRGSLAVAAAALAALAFAPAGGAAVRLVHDSFSTAYRSPGGAVPTGTAVTLRLRVTGTKPSGVTLRVEASDPVTETSTVSTLKLRRRGSVWSVAYRTPAKPSLVSYAFRVKVGRRALWYGDDNSSSDTTKGGTGKVTGSRGDQFRINVYERGFTTPPWLQGAVVYEIFPDRFRNGDPSNDYCREGSSSGCPRFYGNIQATLHRAWNEAMEDSRLTGVFNRDFFGGDLQGVTEELDYIKSLGVDAIWLTPIFRARSNHRYDTEDYHHVDEALGGDPAFAQLAAAAKAKGIHLILDGVFNHTSSDSVYFDRYNRFPDIVGACESPGSPFRTWYEISGNDIPCRTYSGFANLDSLPELNWSNPAVRDFLYRDGESVVRHWTNRGADGWRLDVAQGIEHRWWRDFRTAVKTYASDAPLIGEVTAGPIDASEYLIGDELDGVMNYRFRQAAIGFARTTLFTDSSGSIPPLRPSQLDHALKAVLEDYPAQAAAVSFNLVDSHDTNRVRFAVTEANGFDAAREKQRLVALLQFTTFGAPMVYYGDETGFDVPGKNGFGDPYNRAPYPWADETSFAPTAYHQDPRMVGFYAELGAIRRSLPALKTGSLTTLLTNANVYAFGRVAAPNKPVLVVLNKDDQPSTLTIPARGLYPNGATLRDQRSSFQTTVSGGAIRVQLFQRDGLILVGTS
jgi:glycosidase